MSDDLREAVARAIALSRGNTLWAATVSEAREPYLHDADAVLALLRDRGVLLPEMPEWVQEVTVVLGGGNDRNPPDVPWTDWERIAHGTAPTFAAAIAAALGGTDDR